jgi:hypothetical protein
MKVRPPSPVPQPVPVPPPVQQTTPPPQPVPTPTPPPVGKQTPVPTPQPQDKDQEDDDRSFCERNEQFCDWVGRGVGTGIAVGIGVGIGTELTEYWESLKGIRKVWEKIRGNDDDDDKDKDKDKEKKENKDERPCVDESRTILPSDEIPARSFGPFLQGSFRMGLTFKEDDTGCRCRLGEYRQMIKGFAEHDEGTGVMKPSHPPGMQLSRTQEQEDLREGVEPYGLRDNKLGNNENDSFTPVRDTGCLYRGKDEPGMRHIQPGEHVRFRFEFSGGPVDRRDRQRKIGR